MQMKNNFWFHVFYCWRNIVSFGNINKLVDGVYTCTFFVLYNTYISILCFV